MIIYFDTSAAMKLVVQEPESEALLAFLRSDDVRLASSWLLHTELHCAAGRRPNLVNLTSISIVLDTVVLVDLTRGDLLTAASLPGGLRSNDAIHLATALRLGVTQLLTYDRKLATAANGAGLAVLQPGT